MTGLGLLLDLSHAGFAAVLDAPDDRVLARSARPAGTRHDDAGEWIESLLREAGGGFPDLHRICVGLGPGSFTGIRIAMAFAQGLALPSRVALHGFTTFEALFLTFPGLEAWAVVPANAGRFYAAKNLEDPGALTDAETLKAAAGEGRVLLAPGEAPALDALRPFFSDIRIPGEHWDAPAIFRHAQASGRGARAPYYLQASAAEEKRNNE